MERVRIGAVMLDPIVVVDPEIMNGTPCFRGTRVPLQNLLDYVEGGQSLDEFLRQFPSVTREMAVGALGLEGLALEGLNSGEAVVGDDAFWDARIGRARERVAVLAEVANDGALTSEERTEYEALIEWDEGATLKTRRFSAGSPDLGCVE